MGGVCKLGEGGVGVVMVVGGAVHLNRYSVSLDNIFCLREM